MKTMRFKTNAKCGGCSARIGEALTQRIQPKSWSIDLASGDRTLTIETDRSADEVMQTVREAGYTIEPIE